MCSTVTICPTERQYYRRTKRSRGHCPWSVSGDFRCLQGSGYAGRTMWGSEGPGHNCVSYVAFRLDQKRAARPWPGQIGNAIDRAGKASGRSPSTDTIPAAGAVAWWGTGQYGHIAYVESVGADSVVVSEDSYAPVYSQTRRIARGDPTYPARFIHIKDVTSAPAQPAPPSDLDRYRNKVVQWDGRQPGSLRGQPAGLGEQHRRPYLTTAQDIADAPRRTWSATPSAPRRAPARSRGSRPAAWPGRRSPRCRSSRRGRRGAGSRW